MSFGPSYVDRSTLVPLHLQVRALLLAELESGRLEPGSQIPPEEEYAALLGVSLAPVRQAILGLVEEGCLVRTRGLGTFVCAPRVTETITTLAGFAASMRKKGREVEMQVLSHGLVTPSPQVKKALGTSNAVFELKRLATERGLPIALLTSYLDHRRFPSLPDLDFSSLSLYDVLRDEYGVRVSNAQNVVEIARCTPEEATSLGVRVRTPALEASHVTYTEDQIAVEVARVLYRGDRIRLAFESHEVWEDDATTQKERPHDTTR